MSIEELKRPIRTDENKLEKLKELFPEAFSDGSFNVDILKEELEEIDDDLTQGNLDEFYGLQWTGKKEARKLANLPSDGTLKYENGEGVREDSTKNFLIEGDNLEVLRILRKSYTNKIKLIYIDPPYNTGNDFIYNDDFKESTESYLQRTGQADEEGMLISNPKSSGRFHANWLNMIYPRLKLSRSLLKDDGVIFVSIDDNEHANLKIIMDEIFGEQNFLANIVWQKKYGPANDAKGISATHEHILVYSKNKDKFEPGLLPRNEKQMSAYSNPDNDPRGPWRASDLSARTFSESGYYPIVGPHGETFYPPESRAWIVNEERFKELLADNRITFGKTGTGRPMQKKFLSEVKGGITPETWWSRDKVGDNKTARYEMKEIMPENVFDTPKPSTLINYIIKISNLKENDIVLDFFAGSGTTGHAVMEHNRSEEYNINFILIQIPETSNKREFENIFQIAKERLRRTSRILSEKDKSNGDIGFRVLKYSETNLRKWKKYSGEDLDELNNNIDLFTQSPFMDSSSKADIVTEIMLLQGFPLDSKRIEKQQYNNLLNIVTHKDVPFTLVVCLDEKLNKDTSDFLASKFKNGTLVCNDFALSNEQKVLLSEILNIKTI